MGGPHLASQARRLCEVGKEASKTRRDLLGTTRQREVEIGQRPQVLPETGGQPGGGSLRGVDLLKGRVQPSWWLAIASGHRLPWPGALGTPWCDATLSGGHLTCRDTGRPRVPDSTGQSQLWLPVPTPEGSVPSGTFTLVPAMRSHSSPLRFTHFPHNRHLRLPPPGHPSHTEQLVTVCARGSSDAE